MSLDVRHLNGDSTFLLTFSPQHSEAFTPTPSPSANFTVLLDPWLSGESSIYHPKFALAKLTLPSCIKHLSEIPPPNVVVVSQDRSDHCHEGTLRQLDAALPGTVILAHPAAAKRIRGWKYFDASKVHAFPIFSEKKSNTVIKFHIPSTYPGANPGEATLSFIAPKFDVVGVHNAVGITYRPAASAPPFSPMTPDFFPGSDASTAAFGPMLYGSATHSLPPTPPDSPMVKSRGLDSSALGHTASNALSHEPYQSSMYEDGTPAGSAAHSPWHDRVTSDPQSLLLRPSTAHRHTNSGSSLNFSRPLARSRASSQLSSRCGTPHESMESSNLSRPQTAASPISPAWTSLSSTRSITYTACLPKTISVIYSPHGLTYPTIKPYATSHLIANAALPLTLLLHSFDRIQNPWYLGGNVNAGMPGGLEIARALLARCWISAHDEDKESSGFAVWKTTTRKYTPEEVRQLLEDSPKERQGRKGKNAAKMDVRILGVGEQTLLEA